ncbi:MAG: hypothetical protein EOP06_12545 [Proteobacteria bacterium]|nr:MAG: hypothetical protein EOP06_12545 [Pseudomonadota bacterium]
MAWNKYFIVVTDQPAAEPREIIQRLGIEGWKLKGQTEFSATNKSDDLFIGHYNSHLVISNPDLVHSFFSDVVGEFEQRFIETFPGSVIAVFMENSTVGLFGYSIIEGGQRIRLSDGSDGEIFHDFGSLLPEEEVIRSGDIFDPEELEEMRQDMDEEEVAAMITFEASWRVPKQLSKRYFGQSVEEVAEQIKLSQYVKS